MHLLYTILNIRAEYETKLQQLQQHYATPDPDLKSDIKTEPSVRNIMAYQGKSLVPVSLKEIAYLYKANELTLLRTFAGKEYLLDETLEYFEKTLPNGAFFRLNRQLLAHMSAVKKFSSDGTGRLLIHLEPAFKEEIYVSRRRSPEFQTWIREVTV
jgi:DNA-binding LytR/AlgR family response regulator